MIQCICFVCNCNWIFFHCWQEKFCNKACVERFLKAKNDTVKKAAKQLRNCLSWRDSIGTGLCLLLLVFTVSSQNLAFLYFQILALLIKVLKNLVTIKVDHPIRTKDFDFFFHCLFMLDFRPFNCGWILCWACWWPGLCCWSWRWIKTRYGS